MGNELAATRTSTPTGCETRFSARSLAARVPDWLDRDLIDPNAFALPVRLPEGAVRQLRDAAEAYRRSLAAVAPYAEIEAVMAELRLKTTVRNENAHEARARFRLLLDEVKDVPAEILRDAAREYALTNRFFPNGPAEIIPYVNRLRFDREKRAFVLRRLAGEAEAREAERRRIEDDPLTPEAASAIIDEFRLRPETAEAIRPVGPRRNPTVRDYVDLGVDPETAERCTAERNAART